MSQQRGKDGTTRRRTDNGPIRTLGRNTTNGGACGNQEPGGASRKSDGETKAKPLKSARGPPPRIPPQKHNRRVAVSPLLQLVAVATCDARGTQKKNKENRTVSHPPPPPLLRAPCEFPGCAYFKSLPSSERYLFTAIYKDL
ncbi:growth arrest and DNA-damage-inducible, beta b isoform X2 [Phycodurus eques]|uniref:growth arrest and DNA-damage-inducible, beta b isoform X2 n=1 Tax=Phycodurus eques TaxID=693459 RepID=UPI002ACE7BDA|nr:growth arrest and DNA-damage-inducible, beta b isoform X2 [Phycodurus eques]